MMQAAHTPTLMPRLSRERILAMLLLAMLLLAMLPAVSAAELVDRKIAQGERETEQAEEEAEREERQEARERLMAYSCYGEDEGEEGGHSWLDYTHSYISARLCEPAAWFDGFFGDPRALEETPVGTFFRVRNEVRWDEAGNDYAVRTRLSANVSLPRISRRLRLLLSRDEDLRGEFDEVSESVEPRDRRTRLGLRYIARDKEGSQFDLDGTVRVNIDSLNPIVRGRYRHVWPLSENTRGRFTQLGFWERDDGLGTRTRVDWEWLPASRTQIRWTGQGTFSEASDGVTWRSGIVAFQQLNSRSAVRGELGAFGETRRAGSATEEYFVNFRYRRSFLRPWLFFELQPERAWPQDSELGQREGHWRFTFTLEVQFENQIATERRPPGKEGS